MKRIKWLAGALAAVLLLTRPEAAVNGAREAMAHWYYAVAPSLFPFMALMPLLTCEAALSAYGSALGGIMERAFRLPGAAASALVIGMAAGSPAGCVAAARMAGRCRMSRGQFERLSLACCGLSPAFLISGVGAAMLGDPSAGRLLLRSQLLSQVCLLWLLMPLCRDGGRLEPSTIDESGAAPMAGAVGAILSVCGYMTAFGALAAVMGELAGPAVGGALLCVMDVTSGARLVCGSAMKLPGKLLALSALMGATGACVCAQNLAAIRRVMDVKVWKFALARCAAGLIAMGMTALQLAVGPRLPDIPPVAAVKLSCIFVCLMAVPALVRLKKPVS